MRGDSLLAAESILRLYDSRAAEYDRERGRGLVERGWLERFLGYVPAGGVVLDLGCGVGEPIAGYVIERGFRVVGVDSSAAMIERCRARFPAHEWIVADMRSLELGRRFDGVLAWDSFFHLTMAEQRLMFPRFAAHAQPGAPLMFTCGPAEGEAIGEWHGEPLYHASLSPAEYDELLTQNGFGSVAWVEDDPHCGHHSVRLATNRG